MGHAIAVRNMPYLKAGQIIVWYEQTSASDNPKHQWPAAPIGLIWCSGHEVKIADFPDLFDAIGYNYGPLDIEVCHKGWVRFLFGERFDHMAPNPKRPKPGYFRLPLL